MKTEMSKNHYKSVRMHYFNERCFYVEPIEQNIIFQGFHLSALVNSSLGHDREAKHNTSVTFDRRRIVSCQCTCNGSPDWCSHVVALCLHRIRKVRME